MRNMIENGNAGRAQTVNFEVSVSGIIPAGIE